MDILNITKKPETDESIEKYEYHSNEPITGTDSNRPGEKGQILKHLKHKTCSHIRVTVIWFSATSW